MATRFHRIMLPLAMLAGTLLSGCFFSAPGKPELAYLVAYSILDNRFETSTRLDITADIYNGMDEPMEVVQLTLTGMDEQEFVLDYQTVGKYNQIGRFNAFPLPQPIKNQELLGQDGISHEAPSGLHFLFVKSFRKAVLRYKDSSGVHEEEISNLGEILERSRKETISWMEKEHQERQKYLEEMKKVAQERIAANHAKSSGK